MTTTRFDLSKIPPIEHLDSLVEVQKAFDAWDVPVSGAEVTRLVDRLGLVIRPALQSGTAEWAPDPNSRTHLYAGIEPRMRWTTDMARYSYKGITTTTYGIVYDGGSNYYICTDPVVKNKRTILTLTPEQHAWVKAQSSSLKSMAAVIRDLIDQERGAGDCG